MRNDFRVWMKRINRSNRFLFKNTPLQYIAQVETGIEYNNGVNQK